MTHHHPQAAVLALVWQGRDASPGSRPARSTSASQRWSEPRLVTSDARSVSHEGELTEASNVQNLHIASSKSLRLHFPCWLAPRGGRSAARCMKTADRTVTARQVRSGPWLATEAAVAESATVQQQGRGEIERFSLYALPSTCDPIEDDGA